MKPVWMDRELLVGPYVALCTSEEAYDAALRHIKAHQRPVFVSDGADATTHFFEHKGKTCALVCVRESERSSIEIAGLLVHEAVHIWQTYCEDVGERNPGDETEAYAIQTFAQRLMAAYARTYGKT